MLASFALAPTRPLLCIIVYMVGFCLDELDGRFARMLNQTSTLGAVLDMVTDRIATTGLLALLCCFAPAYQMIWLSVLALDLSSHWFQMYSSLACGNASHKVRLRALLASWAEPAAALARCALAVMAQHVPICKARQCRKVQRMQMHGNICHLDGRPLLYNCAGATALRMAVQYHASTPCAILYCTTVPGVEHMPMSGGVRLACILDEWSQVGSDAHLAPVSKVMCPQSMKHPARQTRVQSASDSLEGTSALLESGIRCQHETLEFWTRESRGQSAHCSRLVHHPHPISQLVCAQPYFQMLRSAPCSRRVHHPHPISQLVCARPYCQTLRSVAIIAVGQWPQHCQSTCQTPQAMCRT
jgi:phosphatidylglycerophosphate synthase